MEKIVIPVTKHNENNDDIQGCSIDLDCFTPVQIQKSEANHEWVKTGRMHLLISHKRKILSGEELNEVIINFAQKLHFQSLVVCRILFYKVRSRIMYVDRHAYK